MCWSKACAHLKRLDKIASEKGEAVLAASLTRPFQRLMKYPLLLQGILDKSQCSMAEYEATLQIINDINHILRSIEDDNISDDDRDRTRDAYARILGLDRVKQLAAPVSNRVLVKEHRLESLHKKDIWLVAFSDVVLRCQRTGVTCLPLAKTTTTADRIALTHPRNLYNLLKVRLYTMIYLGIYIYPVTLTSYRLNAGQPSLQAYVADFCL